MVLDIFLSCSCEVLSINGQCQINFSVILVNEAFLVPDYWRVRNGNSLSTDKKENTLVNN